ncbi:MAG: MFS transporter [Armatimonadetes bacterium]|nr:MFS transporter [Armatimonadota bacterium]
MPYYRRNIIVLSVTIFLAALSWYQIIPYLPDFIKEIGGEKNYYWWVGVIFAVQSGSSILAQPFWGKMGDTYGRKIMIVRAGICLAGVYFAMSICHAPWQLAFCRFLNGALTGFIPGSFALIATNTPEALAPRYVATAQSANAMGLILGPVIGNILAKEMGFRFSLQISGMSILLCTLIVLWLVLEPNKAFSGKKTSMLDDFKIAMGSNMQISIMITVLLAWFPSAAIFPYLAGHIRDLNGHMPVLLSGAVISLPAVAFVISARTWTWVGEYHGYNRAITIGLVGAAISLISLAFVQNVWLFSGMYFTAGLWLASLSPSAGALTCLRVDEGFRGRAYAIQSSVGTFGAMLAPMAASYVAAKFGIHAIFLMVGVVLLAGTLCFRSVVKKLKPEVGLGGGKNERI